MATQTYVTDMQAIGQNTVQVHQGSSQSHTSTTNSQSQGSSTSHHESSSTPHPTIIQPAQGAAGQQFILTISEPPGEQQVQQVHHVQEAVQIQQGGTSQVIYQRPAAQYVEGSSSSTSSDTAAAVYAASNGEMQTYADYGQTTMYTPVSGTYYQASGSTQMGSGLSQGGGLQGQLLTQGTYLIQGGTMDGEGTPLSHTTRASPATDQSSNGQNQRNAHFDVKSWQREVQWLIDNYETAEGVSLPRSTLYNHYLRHCQEQKMDPMNPASFGKLIRSVFLGLRTRRLGTRGNSKYHYYGIRIKATSPLNQYTDDQTMAIRQQPVNPGKRFRPSLSCGGSDGHDGSEPNQHQQHQQYLGDASAAIPNFESIETDLGTLPPGVHLDHLHTFELLYKEHCEAILEIVVNLQFSLIEAVWQSFWKNTLGSPTGSDLDNEPNLPRDILCAICEMPSIQKYVRRSDYSFFQALVEVLIPDVLRPIPSSLTQAIRNFAKSLEGWLKSAMEGVPQEMVKTKVGAVSAFAQTLRRYTSLNHLAQAARAVLQNTTQINQMLTDLNRVDFANVQEQASWVCQCDDSMVHQLEQDFKKTLQAQNSLEQWAVWLEGVVNQVLKPHEGSQNFPKAARQFLLKWSFYSSMVIRDLTLRSAASFGSFHLIRLLYDEYMFYLVEHKVATATGETPIAVMGEVRQFIDLGNMMGLGTLDSESEASNSSTQPLTTATISIIKPSIAVTPSSSGKSQTTTMPITMPIKASSLAKPLTIVNQHGNTVTKVIATSHVAMNNHANSNTSSGHTMATLANTPIRTFTTHAAGQAQAAGLHQHPHVVHTSSGTPTTVTLLTGASGATPTKTIVVVPVSSAGSGDAPPTIKRIKADIK